MPDGSRNTREIETPTGARPLQGAGAAIGFEYVGLAGALRRRIEKEDREFRQRATGLLALFEPGSPLPTSVQVRRLAYQWKHKLPATFRRSCHVDVDRQGRLEIREDRIMISQLKLPNWDKLDGRSLSIVRIGVFAVPPAFIETDETLVAVSAHALARRYERGTRDDAAALRDIDRLYEAYAAAVAKSPAHFPVEAETGRWWCNVMAGAEGARVLTVRTFLGR